MDAKNRNLTSTFFKRGDRLEYVKPGAKFRHVHADRTVETASVLGVYADGFGIPHVRYKVVMKRPYVEGYEDGPRSLALRTFFEHFEERAGAA